MAVVVDDVYLAQVEGDLVMLRTAESGAWSAGITKITSKLAISNITGAAPVLIAEIRRLRAGIEGTRLEHTDILSMCDESEPCGGGDNCACGAGQHNAYIDRLLAGEGT